MYSIITILAVIAGVLLCAIVLIQNPKGGGLSSSFGGVGQQLLGARRSTDVIEKLTWGFAGGLLFLCLATSFFVNKKQLNTTSTGPKSEVEEVQKTKGFSTTPVGGIGGQQPAQTTPAPTATPPAQ